MEVGPEDPQADQPAAIRVPLKPHQLASLHKALVLEREGELCYDTRDARVREEDPFLYQNFHGYHSYTHSYYHSYHYMRHMGCPYHPRGQSNPYQALDSTRGYFRVRANVGILSDIVGYGKTLTALAIIASTPVANIARKNELYYTYNTTNKRCRAATTFVVDRPDYIPETYFIHTTLVVVPKGLVYNQWKRAIAEQTTLRCLDVGNLPDIRRNLPGPDAGVGGLKEHLERYDLVLVKESSLKTLMDYYEPPFVTGAGGASDRFRHPVIAWDRIILDEAHDILNKVPLFDFRFMWLISATRQLLHEKMHGTRMMLGMVLRDVIQDPFLPFLLVRGEEEFVKRSFDIPPPEEHYYLCYIRNQLHAIQPFLSHRVLERVNANDIAGAIRELGGDAETEADLVELVTRDIQRDIGNKTLELGYIQSLNIPEEAREAQAQKVQAEIARLQGRVDALRQRITDLNEKTCPICYDTYQSPIMLPCTHVFCGSCLIQWCRSAAGNGATRGHACPECRNPIYSDQLVAIVSSKQDVATDEKPRRLLAKDVQAAKIIREKPEGRFLIFSGMDASFYTLCERLDQEGITYSELKGSASQMEAIVRRFREGDLRVIMLNARYAGSGIDLSVATDCILMYSMGEYNIQAIGRAQRFGRTTPLHIHHLRFPHEMAMGAARGTWAEEETLAEAG